MTEEEKKEGWIEITNNDEEKPKELISVEDFFGVTNLADLPLVEIKMNKKTSNE